MKYNKGNIPVYITSGASIIISLVTYIYLSTTSIQAGDIKTAKTDIVILGNRATTLEAQYSNIKEGVDQANKDIKEILKILK